MMMAPLLAVLYLVWPGTNTVKLCAIFSMLEINFHLAFKDCIAKSAIQCLFVYFRAFETVIQITTNKCEKASILRRDANTQPLGLEFPPTTTRAEIVSPRLSFLFNHPRSSYEQCDQLKVAKCL